MLWNAWHCKLAVFPEENITTGRANGPTGLILEEYVHLTGQWADGPMDQWANEPMGQFAPLRQWADGPMVQWANGPMGQFAPLGPVGQWARAHSKWSRTVFFTGPFVFRIY